MKFSVKSNDLTNAVSKVINVLPARSSLPILSNLSLKLNKNELEILGTDLEVYINSKVEVEGSQDGGIIIPGKKFYEIIQNLNNRQLSIETNSQNRLTIKSKEGKWNISGEDIGDFPVPEEMSEYKEFKLNAEILNRYLHKAIHAASTDELRRSMNGVFFDIKDNNLIVVSTDGHRLVRITKSNFELDDKLSMLIPVKSCNLLLKLFKGNDKDVNFQISESFIKSDSENITIHSRLIDDTFPNYESVIPLDNEKKLTVNKDLLIDAVKRSIIMSDLITNKTSFTINDTELKVKSANNEFGTDSEETIQCNYSENEEFEISYNGRYLIEALNHFDSSEITFDFSSPLKASIIKPLENEPDEDMMMLVMPVRNN